MRKWAFDIIVAFIWLLIAIGCWWTAYESHIANLGVAHWASEFDQIRTPQDGPEYPTPMPSPIEPPRYSS